MNEYIIKSITHDTVQNSGQDIPHTGHNADKITKQTNILKGNFDFPGSIFRDAKPLNIDMQPWGGTYAPSSRAWLLKDNSNFYLMMSSLEQESCIRSVQKGLSNDVYRDSCLEFFFKPLLSRDEYINFEFNPSGAVHIAVGIGRENRHALSDTDISCLNIWPFSCSLPGEALKWSICACIPFSFLASLLGADSYRPPQIPTGNLSLQSLIPL